ncbi:hypothetical protein NDU88_006055 [Pleurodeles waltl]|uniref:Uncharacterized protein n=1 Tax=Pleurodeles waltl TaxID=8319 RepID=A0AAV7QHN2_PLEWA|nr:hypothetical protein NDU88_006055 [Pleurodeles waltl]
MQMRPCTQEGTVPGNAAAITQSCGAFDAKIGAVGSEVILLRQDLCSVVDGIAKAETQLLGVDDSVASLQQTVSKLMSVANELAS